MKRAEFHGVICSAATADAEWRAFVPGAAQPSVRAGRVAIAAGWSWQDGDIGIACRRQPHFWDAAQNELKPWRDGDAAQIIAALQKGSLTVATDEPCVFWIGEVVALRSSAAGGSVVYWTRADDSIVFAQALPLFERARTAPVDTGGLAEISRFGGSYTTRTILDGFERIPFAHELVVSASLTVLKPVSSFDIRPSFEREADAIADARTRLNAFVGAFEDSRHIMFSGGVDSTLLAAISMAQPGRTTAVNLALKIPDAEADHAAETARDLGMELRSALLHISADQFSRIVASYTSPTLDFGILPTYMVGALARDLGARVLFDGTGGDAWFGFGALDNERIWKHVHHAHPLRPMAARMYGALATKKDIPAWRPLKVIARAPSHADAALAHLCASPLYDVVWDLPRAEWLGAESEVATVLNGLIANREQLPWQRMVTTDGAFIASGAFAAKSGQWSLVRHQQTVYPFLTPNLVDVARRLPRDYMVRDGVAKPLLKTLATQLGVAPERIYRRKSGFQPPLARIVRQPDVRDMIADTLSSAHELDAYMTDRGRKIANNMIGGSGVPTIHTLYPFWNLTALRVWLTELRTGNASQQWCN